MKTPSTDSIALPDGRRITSVRLFIHQPQLHSEATEWVCSVKDLLAFAALARSKACSVENAARDYGVVPIAEWNKTYLNPNPNEVECAFCRAMATCPSVRAKLEAAVGKDFDVIAEDGTAPTESKLFTPRHQVDYPDDDQALSAMMKITGLLEDWITAVRAEVERRLLAGIPVPDFGLELGRKGARSFGDEEAATNLLRKTFRLKVEDVFKFTLKTPTQIEKLHKLSKTEIKEGVKPVLSERQWAKVAALTVQNDPKPSVKPAALIKVPYVPPKISADEFSAVAEEDDEESLY